MKKRLVISIALLSLIVTAQAAKPPSKKKAPPKKHFIFIENAEVATISPFPKINGWDLITLKRNSNIVPYYSFHGNIVGHFTAQQFFLNTVVGLPLKDGSNVKTGFLSFSKYVTNSGQTYEYGSRVIQLADSHFDQNNNTVTYLIRGTKGSSIEYGTLTGVSIVVAAKLDQKNASALFILDPVLRMKQINVNMGSLNFGLSKPN